MTDLSIFSPGAPGSGGTPGGDNIQVGGVAVIDANFNNATPATGAGRANLEWQSTGASPTQISVQTPASVPIKLVDNTATISIVDTVTRTSIGGVTIPANAMGLVRAVRGMYTFDVVQNSGAAQGFTLEVELGGVVVYNSGASVTFATSTIARVGRIWLDLFAKNATNSQELCGQIFLGGSVAPTTGRGNLGSAGPFTGNCFSATTAADTTIARLLEVFVTLTSATTYRWDVRRSQFVLT